MVSVLGFVLGRIPVNNLNKDDSKAGISYVSLFFFLDLFFFCKYIINMTIFNFKMKGFTLKKERRNWICSLIYFLKW